MNTPGKDGLRIPARWLTWLVLAVISLSTACNTYDNRVAPLPVPGAQAEAVSINGAELMARGFLDPDRAQDAFGFDVRAAGLLPVQFVIDNQSGQPLTIGVEEALLQDRTGNAWPLLSSDQATDRVRDSVRAGESIAAGARSSLLTGLAGAVAGAAIGVVAGGSVGEAAGRGAAAGAAVGALGRGVTRYQELDGEVYRDMLDKSLSKRPVAAGALVHGFLFFPGMKGEAESIQALRLPIRFAESETRVVLVPIESF